MTKATRQLQGLLGAPMLLETFPPSTLTLDVLGKESISYHPYLFDSLDM